MLKNNQNLLRVFFFSEIFTHFLSSSTKKKEHFEKFQVRISKAVSVLKNYPPHVKGLSISKTKKNNVIKQEFACLLFNGILHNVISEIFQN